MTRAVAIFLASFVCSVICADENDPKSDGATATAINGTPEIDGKVDAAWKDAPAVEVKKPIAALLLIGEDELATAKVQLLWDAEHVYALWRVKDSQLSAESSDAWAQDSVELFLDENFKRTNRYESDDAQYRVNFNGELSGQGTGYDESNLCRGEKDKERLHRRNGDQNP